MIPCNMKIVADSSSDVLSIEHVPFASAPLKIITSEKEYVDDTELDVYGMVEDLLSYSDKSSTACPSPEDWLNAFGDAQYVFCVTITSNLSGSCNSANIAKNDYEAEHPGRKVLVIDSLSAGMELKLIIEKLQEKILAGKDFEEISREIMEYKEHTGLMFMLESMRNLANNGRVSKIVASAAGVLGIRAVGKASDVGTLEPMEKCRGEKKALPTIMKIMKELKYVGGRVLIGHCFNESAALKLKDLLLKEFPEAQIDLHPTRGLCSFYAEKGGLMVGFEKQGAV